MAISPQQILLNAFWSIAESRTASGQFAALVLPGNRVKTSEDDWRKRLESRAKSDDFPMVYVSSKGGNASTPAKTFGTGSAITVFDHPVSRPVIFEVMVGFWFTTDAKLMPLETEIAAILELLNESVRNETLRGMPGTVRITRGPEIFNGQSRTVVRFNETIECRPYRSTLIN